MGTTGTALVLAFMTTGAVAACYPAITIPFSALPHLPQRAKLRSLGLHVR